MRSLLVLLAWLAFALPVSHGTEHCEPGQSSFTVAKGREGFTVQGPLQVAKLERDNMRLDKQSGRVVPFGYGNAEWEEFKATITFGDEIFRFTRQEKRFYMDGHILVRNGCIIRLLVGRIS